MANLQNTQAETGLISTLIVHPEYVVVNERLKPEYFAMPVNKVLFRIIKELYNSGVMNIDEFNLASKIENSEDDTMIMQNINLAELVADSPYVARETPNEYKALSKDVMKFAFKRKLLQQLRTFENQCGREDVDIGALQNYIYDKLNHIGDEFLTGEDESLIGEKIDKIYAEIIKRAQNGGGIPSKFPTLNDFVTYEKGELVIFSAKRKVGKSVLLANEAIHKARSGINVLYLDSEMSTLGWTERILAMLSQVSIRKIKSQKFDSKEEEEKVLQAIETLKQLPLVHINNPAWTVDTMEATIKKWDSKIGIDLVIMDYIKAPDTDDAYVELGKITNFLKNKVAGAMDLSVIAAAQSNRGGDTGESYRIEQYCSTLVKIVEKTPDEIRRDGIECGKYKLFVSLNRNGKSHGEIDNDYIDINFFGEIMTMQEAKQHICPELPI
ncbi:MAG: AAA family ATPase [Clostridia bacterium]|nr:AAA family ATPase [Clostridia bacterium]